MKNTSRYLYKLSLLSGMAVFLSLLIAGSMNIFSAAADNPADTGDNISSAGIPAQTSTDPAIVGKWEVQGTGSSTVDNSWADHPVPIHISLLPNGKLLFWGRDKRTVGTEIYDDQGYTTARVWDPFYKTFKVADLKGDTPATLKTKTNLFCSGHSFLPDGRLLVTGGHNILDSHPLSEGMGSKHTNIYDFKSNTWSSGPDMNNGRWYPYNLTLGNGETLVVAGQYLSNATTSPPRTALNEIAQIYSPQGSWRDVSPLAPVITTPINNYPLLHLLSNGKALVATSASDIRSYVLNPSPISGQGTWTIEGQLSVPHDRTTAVLYQKDKVLIAGGAWGLSTLGDSEVYERNQSGVLSWRGTAPLTYRRVYQTSTLLPDGKVLVTGGTTCDGTNSIDCASGAAKTPELWNPEGSGTWSQMASHQEPRAYHSSAILLPDARVLVGGGGLPAAEGEFAPNNNEMPCLSWYYQQPGNIPVPPTSACRAYGHRNVEIFSPPYLFNHDNNGATTPATRPVIVSAPDELTYKQNFVVGVGTVTAQEIESAVLIRLGSVTHGFNQDQRRVPLTITARDGSYLNINAPDGGNDCPPGHYMLFLLKRNADNNLTPSVAKIVRVNKISTPENTIALAGSGISSGSQTIVLPVTVASSVNWTASVTSGSNFISITSPSGTFTGSGNLIVNVAANGGDRRSGVITIGVPGEPVFNQVINIYQGKQYADVPSDIQAPGKLNALAIALNCTRGSGYFCPDLTITRAEVAEFFIKAIHGADVQPPTPPSNQTPTFTDVQPSHPLYAYIEDFAKRGFTSGCGTNLFCPNYPVSRTELAVFLTKALNIVPPVRATQTYQDVPTTFWAHSYIEEVASRKLMRPCPIKIRGTWFCPTENVKRQEVAEALSNAFSF